MIYAITTFGLGYVKFGISNSPERRLEGLQTACPLDLEIAATADWGNLYESRIHRYLAPNSVRGEWFEDSFRTQAVIRWMRDTDQGQADFDKAYLEDQQQIAEMKRKKEEAERVTYEASRLEERKAWWKANGTKMVKSA